MLLSFHAVVDSPAEEAAEEPVVLELVSDDIIVPSNISERSVAAWDIAPPRSCEVSETLPVLFPLQAANIAAIRITATAMARVAFFMFSAPFCVIDGIFPLAFIFNLKE